MYYYPYMYPYPYPNYNYYPYDARQYVGPPSYPAPAYIPEQVEADELHEEEVRQNDQGRRPFVVNIDQATERNRNFRTAIWTGEHLQVVLMSLRRGEDIGLEVHRRTDQFIRVEEGRGVVQMGRNRNNLNFRRNVREGDAIMVPAGMWHNLTNTGNEPLRVYTIYAPPEHPFGTVQRTKMQPREEEE